MRKYILASLIALMVTPVYAHGHGNYWVPFVGGAAFGYIISQPRPVYVYPQPQVVYQQPAPVYVYPQQQIPNTVCELKSEMVNGQLVQGQFCYNR